MARRFVVVFLTLGAVFGFASGFRHRFPDRREAFERHVADICADSALHAYKRDPSLAHPPPP